jgi:8-oxo-dGTP diphosphatase
MGPGFRRDCGILVTSVAESKPILLVAAVALIDADGRVLLAERPQGKHLAGLWEFPGGKVQPGETPEAALVRELGEELGIDVHESCLAPFTFASHAYPDFHLLMPLYVCRKWSGIVTSREGQLLKWVRPSRLGDYEMPPADKPLVAMLRDLLSEGRAAGSLTRSRIRTARSRSGPGRTVSTPCHRSGPFAAARSGRNRSGWC